MSLPPERSFGAIMVAMSIFAKYVPDGLNHRFGFGAEHDEFFVYVEPEQVSEEDTKILEALGFNPDDRGSFQMWC